jgi:hypothetical protein
MSDSEYGPVHLLEDAETRDGFSRRPARISRGLDGLRGDSLDAGAVDAEIGEFAVRKPAQFVQGVAVAAPVAIAADQLQGILQFVISTANGR